MRLAAVVIRFIVNHFSFSFKASAGRLQTVVVCVERQFVILSLTLNFVFIGFLLGPLGLSFLSDSLDSAYFYIYIYIYRLYIRDRQPSLNLRFWRRISARPRSALAARCINNLTYSEHLVYTSGNLHSASPSNAGRSTLGPEYQTPFFDARG